MSYDVWKATEPDTSRWGAGAMLTGRRRFDADVALLLTTIRAGDSTAAWWARHAVKSARACGLWPSTEQLERQTRKVA